MDAVGEAWIDDLVVPSAWRALAHAEYAKRLLTRAPCNEKGDTTRLPGVFGAYNFEVARENLLALTEEITGRRCEFFLASHKKALCVRI